MKTLYIILHGHGEPTSYIFSDKDAADEFARFKNKTGTGLYFVQQQRVYDSFDSYKEENLDDYLSSLQCTINYLQDRRLYYIRLLSEETSTYKNVQIKASQARKYIEALKDSKRIWVSNEDDEFVVTHAEKDRLQEIVNENESEIQNVIKEMIKAREIFGESQQNSDEDLDEMI